MSDKKIKRAALMKAWQSVFRCPLCHARMSVSLYKSLICEHGHTFDISKQGYVNFLTKPVKSQYRRALFEARRELFETQKFFDPLRREITEIISCLQSPQKPMTVLDAGCGEGSHVSAVCRALRAGNSVMGIGIDISKEGVLSASKAFGEDTVFAVADVADTPFGDSSFDVIMSILSPSNYKEYSRLLKHSGAVIKVVPQRDYLKEVREFFFGGSEKRKYTNDSSVSRFQAVFRTSERRRLRYTKTLSQSDLTLLVQMTPLTWKHSEEKIQHFISRETAEITVDVDMLIGIDPL
ncbi:methyltransferase domain-containing protein [Pseudomonas sp. ISL-88]|uniref:putative RNA methyltransferase n=2 Tax=Bacteria TaxID=2 RepID=UPI001BE70190|nr:methyltransferase domain-containing protein [Pseudomonas sp. ISL-88]MBT2713688.1 methyltransferase domain-containing protein [Pseudomonas sp. ISL-88]